MQSRPEKRLTGLLDAMIESLRTENALRGTHAMKPPFSEFLCSLEYLFRPTYHPRKQAGKVLQGVHQLFPFDSQSRTLRRMFSGLSPCFRAMRRARSPLFWGAWESSHSRCRVAAEIFARLSAIFWFVVEDISR